MLQPANGELFFESMKDVLFKHQLALVYYSLVLATCSPQKDQLLYNKNCLKNLNVLVQEVYTRLKGGNSCPENVKNIEKLYMKHFDWVKGHLEKIKKEQLSKKLSSKKPKSLKVASTSKGKGNETSNENNEPKSNQNNVSESNLSTQHQIYVPSEISKIDSTSSTTMKFQKTSEKSFRKSHEKNVQNEQNKSESEKSAPTKESSSKVTSVSETDVFEGSHDASGNVEIDDSVSVPYLSLDEVGVIQKQTLQPLNSIEERQLSNEQIIVTKSIDTESPSTHIDISKEHEEVSKNDANTTSATSVSTKSQSQAQTADPYVVQHKLESPQEMFEETYKPHQDVSITEAQSKEIEVTHEELAGINEYKKDSSCTSTNIVEEPPTRKTFEETMKGFIKEGQDIEAGSLYMRWKASHPSLNNLNAALAFAHKFKKNGK